MQNRSDNRIPAQAGLCSRLRKRPFAEATDRFFNSWKYFFLIGLMTVLSNAFSLELPVYAVFVLIGIYLSFFGKDYLPLMPIVICCYIAPSQNNNPGRNEGSIFFGASGVLLMVLAGLFVASLIFRLATDPDFGGKAFFRRKRMLLPGILVLGAAYLLAGVGSGHYFEQGFGNLLFGFLQFASIFVLYYILCGAVKWNEASRHYMAWTGLCVGFVLLAEIANIYLTQNVIVDGQVVRVRFYTGWGHYNNIGALLSMMIPFAFQLACRSKKSWLYYLCGAAFLLGVLMTCSRGSLIFAVAVYVTSCFVVLFKSRNRRVGLYTNLITFGIITLLFLIFHQQLLRLFADMLGSSKGFSDRADGYAAGIKQFLEHPIFGGSFFPHTDANLYHWSQVEAFSSFFPARWHNTVIQIAASCGIVGILAYCYHRFQTVLLVIKKPTPEVLCIGISAMALLLTSLLDCHLFNIGPTMFYSMCLAFAEHCPTATPKKTK